MKVKQCFFLPLFLCFALLFRMYFLSFGPIKHTVIPFQKCTITKSKLPNAGIKKRQYIAEHSDAAFNSLSKLKKPNRGVVSRKLKLPLLSLISVRNLFTTTHTKVSKTNPFILSENTFLSSQKFATSSILRV
jgi:hypothetical protein